MLKPFKFLVQAVVLEEDDEGNVTGELPGPVITLYGAKRLAGWAEAFDAGLVDAPAPQAGTPEPDA